MEFITTPRMRTADSYSAHAWSCYKLNYMLETFWRLFQRSGPFINLKIDLSDRHQLLGAHAYELIIKFGVSIRSTLFISAP